MTACPRRSSAGRGAVRSVRSDVRKNFHRPGKPAANARAIWIGVLCRRPSASSRFGSAIQLARPQQRPRKQGKRHLHADRRDSQLVAPQSGSQVVGAARRGACCGLWVLCAGSRDHQQLKVSKSRSIRRDTEPPGSDSVAGGAPIVTDSFPFACGLHRHASVESAIVSTVRHRPIGEVELRNVMCVAASCAYSRQQQPLRHSNARLRVIF